MRRSPGGFPYPEHAIENARYSRSKTPPIGRGNSQPFKIANIAAYSIHSFMRIQVRLSFPAGRQVCKSPSLERWFEC